jgi:predicted nuclease of predicted toxin-antitoxin system
VKLLVDMNLSPRWIERLARHGFEAVHWSTVGAATAPDSEILTWANEHGFVVITNDLDFSAILAASAQATPTVVQIRLRTFSLTRSSAPSFTLSKRIGTTSSVARCSQSTRQRRA